MLSAAAVVRVVRNMLAFQVPDARQLLIRAPWRSPQMLLLGALSGAVDAFCLRARDCECCLVVWWG